MGAEPSFREMLTEIKAALQSFETRDTRTMERVSELESSLNEILVGMRRPGGESYGDSRDLERKSAIQMCVDRDSWQHQKNEGRWIEYHPGCDTIG